MFTMFILRVFLKLIPGEVDLASIKLSCSSTMACFRESFCCKCLRKFHFSFKMKANSPKLIFSDYMDLISLKKSFFF